MIRARMRRAWRCCAPQTLALNSVITYYYYYYYTTSSAPTNHEKATQIKNKKREEKKRRITWHDDWIIRALNLWHLDFELSIIIIFKRKCTKLTANEHGLCTRACDDRIFLFFFFSLLLYDERIKRDVICRAIRSQQRNSVSTIFSFSGGEFDSVLVKENSWFLYFYHLVLFLLKQSDGVALSNILYGELALLIEIFR
jgi:hypothetical protein